MEPPQSVFAVTPEEWKTLGFSKPFVSSQFYDWIYKKKIDSFSAITNIAKDDLRKMEERYVLRTMSIAQVTRSSKDKTAKALLKTSDGLIVECVLIPDRSGEDYTLCLSVQIGCSFNCGFCATGKLTYRRNLTSFEIVEEFLLMNQLSGDRVKNVVFMGMGEPFAVGGRLYQAMDVISDPKGMAFSARRISISTSGVLKGIQDLSNYPRPVNLLVSLHSAIQEKRDVLMPNLKGQPLVDLKKNLSAYMAAKRQMVTLEYIMLKGVNDGFEDSKRFVEFCRGLNVKINLIAYNEVPGVAYQSSPKETIELFKSFLKSKGLEVVQRYKKGDDINGACGQLALR